MFDRQQSIRDAVPVDVSGGDQEMPSNRPTRAVYVGTGGNLVVELVDQPGVARTYVVASCSRHTLQVSKFISSGTTAGSVMAEF